MGEAPNTGIPFYVVFRDAAWPFRQLGAESAFRGAVADVVGNGGGVVSGLFSKP